MRIGQLAARTGVNPKTIRYYEYIRLLPEPRRTPGGYRDNDQDDVERLAFVRRARQLGFSLDDIGEILAPRDQGRRRAPGSPTWPNASSPMSTVASAS